MNETDDAIILAYKVLERMNADPDDDLAILARAFLRAMETVAALTSWRSIDTPPHDDREVWGVAADGLLVFARWSLLRGWEPPHITAWMELPKLPKKDDLKIRELPQ
jgi:hypothetical protein